MAFRYEHYCNDNELISIEDTLADHSDYGKSDEEDEAANESSHYTFSSWG
jgi:hypothetical protein